MRHRLVRRVPRPERGRAEARDLVVAYAEGRGGGVVEQYLRRAFPRFWQKVESTDFEAIGPSLGLTPPREADILTDMATAGDFHAAWMIQESH